MSLWQFNACAEGYVKAHGGAKPKWTAEDDAWFDALPTVIEGN